MVIVNGSGMFYSGSREPGLEWVRGRRLARWYNEPPKRIRWWEGGVRMVATLEGGEYRRNGRLEAHAPCTVCDTEPEYRRLADEWSNQ